MSFDGQVDCQRIEIGPACPLDIMGKARAAVPAAPVAALRNLRRSAAMPVCIVLVPRGGDLRIMWPPETSARAPDAGAVRRNRSVGLPGSAARPPRSALIIRILERLVIFAIEHSRGILPGRG